MIKNNVSLVHRVNVGGLQHFHLTTTCLPDTSEALKLNVVSLHHKRLMVVSSASLETTSEVLITVVSHGVCIQSELGQILVQCIRTVPYIQ